MRNLGISEERLLQLSVSVAAQMGLHFPRARWRELERAVAAAAGEAGFEDAEAYAQWLLSSPLSRSKIEALAGRLTVGETYFFREKRTFELFEEHLFPELVHARRGSGKYLRIWSAGCCTGEEPYSIAILLHKIIYDLPGWNVSILATDVNPHFLHKANEGRYGKWSFRSPPAKTRERYFKQVSDDSWEILPGIKKMVTFYYLNLAEDTYPSLSNNTNAMDVIFCRNVLMYFDPEQARKVLHRLYLTLVEGGWLVVSPSDACHLKLSQFTAVSFPGAILYRKDSRPRQRSASFPAMQEKKPEVPPPCALPVMPIPPPVWTAEQTKAGIAPVTALIADSEPKALPDQSSRSPLFAQENQLTGLEVDSALCAEARALYEQGCYAEAAEKAMEHLVRAPDDACAMALLARIHANRGSLAEALKWCENAIAADKMKAGYHFLQATILQEQNQAPAAVLALKRALYLDQDFVMAHVALGNIAHIHGKHSESRKHFENALSLLGAHRPDEILPELEGLTVHRLTEIIRSMIGWEKKA